MRVIILSRVKNVAIIGGSLSRVLMNGNEAVAWAAISSNVQYFAHYPGSPIAEVEPKLKELNQKYSAEIVINNALNEHIAALACGGASFSGARSLLVMKHVGLNIASDPLNYLGLTGVEGGMVIVVGTDPGVNCSTGEEDVHWYVPQMNFPLFEPATTRDIYSQVGLSFELSESYKLPVFIFIPNRLCFNADSVEVPNDLDKVINSRPRNFWFKKSFSQYVNVGKQAVANHKLLLKKIENISKKEKFTKSLFNSNSKTGVITRGTTFANAYESVIKLNIEDQIDLLNIELVYPLNTKEIGAFLSNKSVVYIIEDQDGFLEYQVKQKFFNDINCKIYGKDFFPPYDEVTFFDVFSFFKSKFYKSANDPQTLPRNFNLKDIPERLGTFCEGCGHRSSFYVIDKVIKSRGSKDNFIIGGDIGCSSLPPQRADWLMCMNSGIGISAGMSHILKDQQVISTGGDASFFHAGLLTLQNAIENKQDLLHLVFDNKSIGMTGHQSTPTTKGVYKYRQLLESIGVDKVMQTDALNPGDYEYKLNKLLDIKGVRVLWVNSSCSQLPTEEMLSDKEKKSYHINNERCGECTSCYTELQCPAIIKDKQNCLENNLDICSRCSVCREICPNEAIEIRWKDEK